MQDIKIGKTLQKLRKEKGLTQQSLGDIMHVSPKTVSKWECDDALPELTTLIQLSKFYEVPIDEIINNASYLSNFDENTKETINNEYENKNSNIILPRDYIKYKLLVISSIGLGILGLIITLSIGYSTLKGVLAGTIGLIPYLVSIIMYFLIQVVFNNNVVFKDDELITKEKRKYKYLYLGIIGSSIIISLIMIIFSPSFGIIVFGYLVKFSSLPIVIYLLILIFAYFKDYFKNIKIKYQFIYLGVTGLLIIFFTVLLIVSPINSNPDVNNLLLFTGEIFIVYVITVLNIYYNQFFEKFKRIRIGLIASYIHLIYIMYNYHIYTHFLSYGRVFGSLLLLYLILATIFKKLPSFVGYIFAFIPYLLLFKDLENTAQALITVKGWLSVKPVFGFYVTYIYLACILSSIALTVIQIVKHFKLETINPNEL